jgi:hypothetical protein
VNAHDVVMQQKHLTDAQQSEHVLTHFKELFSGQVGCFPHLKVPLELKAGATLS